ncbi:hypothetical protein ACQPWY_04245 [Pseudonocardia xinjiangensis]|uniref:hypothetical protein n=1 Tax=Pseudonocardia xinjiangensis TaxID=75289 RepID=UPI003D93D5B3
MGIPSRLLLAGSVLGLVTASGGAMLIATSGTATAAEKTPRFDDTAAAAVHTPEPAGTAPAAVKVPEFDSTVPAPGDPATPIAAPPVTGAQIAGLALNPARDRVAAILAERTRAEEVAREVAAKAAAARAEAQRAAAAKPPPDPRHEAYQRMHARISEACDDGRLRGSICRGT